jgi:hypothetical protein
VEDEVEIDGEGKREGEGDTGDRLYASPVFPLSYLY